MNWRFRLFYWGFYFSLFIQIYNHWRLRFLIFLSCNFSFNFMIDISIFFSNINFIHHGLIQGFFIILLRFNLMLLFRYKLLSISCLHLNHILPFLLFNTFTLLCLNQSLYIAFLLSLKFFFSS